MRNVECLDAAHSLRLILMHRRVGCLVVVGSLLLLTLSNLLADEPTPPPRIVENISHNRKILARSDPWTNETTIYDVNPDGTARNVLWKFPKWLSGFEVTGDGNVIVVQDADLLPENAGDDYVLLSFIDRGKVIRKITVGQLLGSRSKLRETMARHLSWGRGLDGIDENGFAFVDTIVGSFIFDAHTGKCVFPPNNQIDPVGAR